jgi:ribose 5-phosphate isomerase B
MPVIALGADHAGFALKEDLKTWLSARGHDVRDFGTTSLDSVDYPDYAAQVARAVAEGEAQRGVLVCGSGLGMAIAANKVPGVRAVACYDPELARLSREHNDANVLTLGGRFTDKEAALAILAVWLETRFAGGRHARRVEMLTALDERRSDAPAR